MYKIKKMDFDGTIEYDIFDDEGDPVDCGGPFNTMESAEIALKKINLNREDV